MGAMHKARILAFQIIYSWDFTKKIGAENLCDSIKNLSKEEFDLAAEAYVKLTVCGTIENIDTIDRLIKDNLNKWKFDRIAKVDLAILRLSVYGLLFQKDTDGKIIINEAVKIAQEYGNDDSYKFINGTLDSIYKKNDKT